MPNSSTTNPLPIFNFLNLFQLEKMKKLIDSTVNGFTYQLYNVSYPEGKENAWYKEFRPCSTARLFLPVSYSKTNLNQNVI